MELQNLREKLTYALEGSRLVRPNHLGTCVIAVVEVNLKPSDLLKYRESYETSNRFKCTLYKYSFTSNEGKFLDNS